MWLQFKWPSPLPPPYSCCVRWIPVTSDWPPKMTWSTRSSEASSLTSMSLTSTSMPSRAPRPRRWLMVVLFMLICFVLYIWCVFFYIVWGQMLQKEVVGWCHWWCYFSLFLSHLPPFFLPSFSFSQLPPSYPLSHLILHPSPSLSLSLSSHLPLLPSHHPSYPLSLTPFFFI